VPRAIPWISAERGDARIQRSYEYRARCFLAGYRSRPKSVFAGDSWVAWPLLPPPGMTTTLSRSLLRLSLLLGVSAIAVLAGACSADTDAKVGTCKVEEGDYIGPTTGFWYDEKHYCATEVDCNAHCAQVKGQDNIGSCAWNSFKSCSGALPAKTKDAEYCAIALTMDCGDGESTSVECIGCSDPPLNESDYDGTCRSQYGGSLGRGKTCEEAKAAVK
jgi:hypothetical protein